MLMPFGRGHRMGTGTECRSQSAAPDAEVRDQTRITPVVVKTRQRGFVDFFASRWRGEVPFDRLFWFDMLVVGTLVNLAAGALSVILLALDAPAAAAIAVFFSPLPYNLFLFAAVWRAAEQSPSGWVAARLGAVVWLAFATLI